MVNFNQNGKSMRNLLFLLALFLTGQVFFSDAYADTKSATLTQQQVVDITGTVKDESGGPLAGVSVVVEGTSIGTATNIEGQFTLKTTTSATLKISYLGYATQNIKLDGRKSIDIVMKEDAAQLGEVVIVGYGSQRKGNVLSSIATVSAEDLERSTASTTSGALVGKMAGITSRQSDGTPGSSTNLQIRNMGNPLYVIDGIIKDAGQFNNLDVNDIETISVLKDGAAAIYGVKAANGVILVKTKRGTAGKTEISFNGYYGWQSWTRFPEMGDGYEFTRGDYERRVNSGQAIDVELSKAELEKWRTGLYDPTTGQDYRGFDWTSFARDNVPQSYYSVNASGGSEKMNYYIAISRIDQDAVFKDYNFNRNNIQTNLDAWITKFLKASFSMNGRIETRDNPGLPGDNDYWNARLGMMWNHPTYRPFVNDNPKYPTYLPYNQDVNLGTMVKDISGFYEENWRVFQGNWGLEYQSPIKGLTAKFAYSYYYAFGKRNNFEKAYDMYTYDRANEQYVVAYRKADSWMQKQDATVEENVYQGQINYDNTFNKKHHVYGLVGAETYKRNEGNLRIGQNPTESNILPILTDNREIIAYINDYYKETANAGYVGKVGYDFEGKYLVEFSGRYDGSYKFPANNRWGFFPSVAAGYRLSEENFFKNSSVNNWLSNVKFRISYGELGDDDLGSIYPDLAYLGGYSFNKGTAIISNDPTRNIDGSVVKGSESRRYPITDLTWIKTKMFNVGVDLGFFNNRLNLELDYFNRSRSDLPATRSDLILPDETGIAVPPENLNSDRNLGTDGFIKWSDKVGDFEYYAGINGTLARKMNGITYGQSFNNSLDEYRWSTKNRWANVTGGSNTWATKIIGQFKTQEEIDNYPVIMDDQGNRTVLPGDFIYEDTNGDGRIDGNDERPLGYGEDLPYLSYGINLGLSWKGIDFAVDFAGASMQTLVYDFEAKWPFQNGGNSPAYMLNDRWHHEDIFDPTSPWVAGERPAIRMDNWREGGSYRRWNSYFMSNTNYFRLKNLEIGYTLPKSWTSKVSIKKVRIYGLGTNLFSFDNMKDRGIDPEQGARSGLDYPPLRVITVGANITF